MSEEMAATETSEKAEVNGDEALPAASSSSSGAVEPSTVAEADAPVASDEPSTSKDDAATIQQENTDDDKKADEETKSVEESKSDEQIVETVKEENDVEVKKRKRATSPEGSDADDGEEFRGFDTSVVEEMETSIAEYSNIIDRLESDINTSRASLSRTLGTVTASPRTRNTPASNHQTRNNPKRLKLDSDASRPSSALSSRSEGDGATSNTDASSTSSPSMRGRRATTEMSSPLLRVPLDKGWKRELVYRANVDAYNRRNADIYYYTPAGKKLRSTREVGENLSGTGLTLENFSFFKEPLGIDDPDKEVIRDARLMRRIDTPVATPPTPVEGKRAPKPKAPKGASPEPATITSPPAKIKVKSMGSRLSGTATPPKQAAAKQKQVKKEKPTTTTTTDNNNTTWKKPRPAESQTGPKLPADETHDILEIIQPPPPKTPPPAPLLSPSMASPVPSVSPAPTISPSPSRPLLQQPCSMSCGDGVPALSCVACLCLYHPACVGLQHATHEHFLCKNCSNSPITPPSQKPVPTAPVPIPVPVPVPVPKRVPKPVAAPKQPVTLTMKVSGSDNAGGRVWSVGRGAGAKELPQSIAVLNGRRFVVVPRPAATSIDKPRRGLSNGTTPTSTGASSPRRRKKIDEDHFTHFYNKSQEMNYDCVTHIFQYLGMRELAQCARVCKLWRDIATTPALWRHVRMKNSHVSDWAGLCALLKRHGTTRLDLRKMLLPSQDNAFWEQFAANICMLHMLERIEMCRCPASAVEAVCRGLPNLKSLSALAVRDGKFNPEPLGCVPKLTELRLKSMAGLSLSKDLSVLSSLKGLTHLSLTSIKELGCHSCEVVGSLPHLQSLELGECSFPATFGAVLAPLRRLRRLRLERGADCAAPALLRALATLPSLRQLELVNFDVKVGFDDALGECKNIQRLLIIPTYVSQSATTNKQVLSGVLKLKDTLTHLMWGVTIELLRVTELFIDQCDQGADSKRKDIGECIPVLKPVPGCKLPDEHHHVTGPPQVEILPLPTLQRLLSAQLPNTKLKLLRIPFHATWRQSLADFQ